MTTFLKQLINPLGQPNQFFLTPL
ncbi:uncharacterized protein METZ01_LOCUS458700, partial [marine metagenome]